jgi:hypothetical protein
MANAKASRNPDTLPTSPSLAQTLPSDAVLDALMMMLIGASLTKFGADAPGKGASAFRPYQTVSKPNLKRLLGVVRRAKSRFPGYWKD